MELRVTAWGGHGLCVAERVPPTSKLRRMGMLPAGHLGLTKGSARTAGDLRQVPVSFSVRTACAAAAALEQDFGLELELFGRAAHATSWVTGKNTPMSCLTIRRPLGARVTGTRSRHPGTRSVTPGMPPAETHLLHPGELQMFDAVEQPRRIP